MTGSGSPKTQCEREKRSFVPTNVLVTYTANKRSPENSYLVRLPVLDQCGIPHLIMLIARFNLHLRTAPDNKSWLRVSRSSTASRTPLYISMGMGTAFFIFEGFPKRDP
jgi:hypothetical protein